jgi:F-type H+-transporting ATPase subunit b
MSLLLPDSGLLFWMALSFGILFFIVGKWGFPVITRMAEERKAYIDKSLQTADEVNRQWAEIKTRTEAMMEETRTRQLAMLRETAQSKEQILADAKETAQRETQKLIDAAQKQIRLEREAVLAEMRSEVAILAIDIAEKVLRNKLKEEERHTEFMNRLIEEARRNKLGA